jgi:hypothetical protein
MNSLAKYNAARAALVDRKTLSAEELKKIENLLEKRPAAVLPFYECALWAR